MISTTHENDVLYFACMKYTLLILAATLALGGTATAYAQTPDHYADAVAATNFQFQSEGNILGVPDRAYADTNVNGAYLKLDMGEGEEGTGNLTLHYETWSAQAQLVFDFYSADGTLLHSYGNYVPIQNTWVISYPIETPYRYVAITSKATATIRLDAIESEGVVSSVTVEDIPFPTEEPEDVEIIDAHPLRGSLVKLTDDWNDATNADKVVYLLDADNVRHIIPNEAVFRSWNLSFNDVTVIGSGTLTGMPLGKNVFVRPGSYLVKILASPNVYAVEKSGILRWIQTEELAAKLYGTSWNKRVIDVPETLFAQYRFGGALTEAKYIDGSFVKTPAGSVWYMDAGGLRYSIGPKTLDALKLRDEDLTTSMSEPELAAAHEFSGRLVYQDSDRWPF